MIVWKLVILLFTIIGGIAGFIQLNKSNKTWWKFLIIIVVAGTILVLYFPEYILVIYPDNNKADVGQTQTSTNQKNTIDTGTVVGNKNNSNIGAQTPAPIQPIKTKEIVPVKKERFEATGVSGYKLEKEWALEEAEEFAKKKLLNRLNKSSITYDIVKEKSTVNFFDGNGWKATVVIFTYE